MSLHGLRVEMNISGASLYCTAKPYLWRTQTRVFVTCASVLSILSSPEFHSFLFSHFLSFTSILILSFLCCILALSPVLFLLPLSYTFFTPFYFFFFQTLCFPLIPFIPTYPSKLHLFFTTPIPPRNPPVLPSVCSLYLSSAPNFPSFSLSFCSSLLPQADALIRRNGSSSPE